MVYYHVIKKLGQWHLYADHGATVLAADTTQAAVVRTARTLARQHGARVVLHKEEEAGERAGY